MKLTAKQKQQIVTGIKIIVYELYSGDRSGALWNPPTEWVYETLQQRYDQTYKDVGGEEGVLGDIPMADCYCTLIVWNPLTGKCHQPKEQNLVGDYWEECNLKQAQELYTIFDDLDCILVEYWAGNDIYTVFITDPKDARKEEVPQPRKPGDHLTVECTDKKMVFQVYNKDTKKTESTGTLAACWDRVRAAMGIKS